MRVVRVGDLKPGAVVGRALMDDKGQILLQRGVALTAEYIQALRGRGYTKLFVADPDPGVEVEPEEDLSPATRAKAMNALKTSFEEIERDLGTLRRQSYEHLLKACNSDHARVLVSEKGPLAAIQSVIDSVLNEILTQSTLAGLTSIKSADAELYEHSIDVCVVGVMIGRACGLDNARVRQLATGCLLHDIGMMFVDPAADRVTQIKQHTRLGYELLKNNEDPDIMAPHVAYEHHERQDGRGLPRGTVGSNTLQRNRSLSPPIPTLIGEIAAVADIYDMLLSGAGSHPAMTPDTALQAIHKAAGAHLNRAVVEALMRVVPVYPLGMEVIVRSEQLHNYSGIVTAVNPDKLDRPRITLVRNNAGRAIEPTEIDLMEKPEMHIRCRGL